MAHPKFLAIRERYSFCCGYCGVSEIDVGGGLTVDHFVPLSLGGDDRENNLVYACVRCNQYKGAQDALGPDGKPGLLHPLLDDATKHSSADPVSGLLTGLTSRGAHHIAVLRLNRPALVANRQRGELERLLELRLDRSVAEAAGLREQLARQELYIACLEERLEKRRE